MIKVLALFLALLFTSPPVLAADAWVCPMHCEGTKTYDHPGQCPVCHMKLDKQGEKSVPLNTRDYRVDQTLDPKPLRADASTALSFFPRHTKDGSPVKDLVSPLQATMVSDDLTALERLKIEKLPDYGYRALVRPLPGKFLVFVEFAPTDGPPQVFPLAMEATGGEKPVTKLKPLSKSQPKESEQIWLPSVRDCLLINEAGTYFQRIALKTIEGKTICQSKPRAGLYRVWFDSRRGAQVADFHIH